MTKYLRFVKVRVRVRVRIRVRARTRVRVRVRVTARTVLRLDFKRPFSSFHSHLFILIFH